MANNSGFMGLEAAFTDRKRSAIAVLPVPYDGTSTWIKGADKGPSAIISASSAVELYDIETGKEIYRKGIYTAAPVKTSKRPEKMVKEVYDSVSALMGDKKFVVMLGGEHSVTVGSVRAHAERYKGLSVLQLDAHSDLRREYEGSPYNHACVMSRVKEICPIAQVGIRSMCVEEKDEMTRDRVFFAADIAGKKDWYGRVSKKLTKDVYVTIDLDVFDPAIMPSTGTPEPGGMDWYSVTGLLRKISKEHRIRGFDIVELCPEEHNKAPDFMAAKLIYTFLSYIF
ncbi:MAG: agmatinase [Candidatus Omnitrophica bacterium]|nr:agmatinase [Candidatus Omnitrophota bacterium]MDD5488691.1 agmatinase [Candidatus Omnitrophota bacterium]